jgi:beta-phosphoglucomutase
MSGKNDFAQSRYGNDVWNIVEERLDESNNLRNETIFSLGNGYIGMRGNLEEGFPGSPKQSVNGTYINAFFESEPIVYPEGAYGYAENSQTMINVTNAKAIELTVDGEIFNVLSGKFLSYQRKLDLNKGHLTRDMEWETPTGKRVRIRIRRLVSLNRKHAAAIDYEVTPLNFSGTIELRSVIDGAVRNQVSTGDPRLGSALMGQVLQTMERTQEGTLGMLRQQTKNTKFTIVCAAEHELSTDARAQFSGKAEEDRVEAHFTIDAAEGQTVRLTKYIAYHTSKESPESEAAKRLAAEAKQTVDQAKRDGFSELLKEQEQFLSDYWLHSDVEITGDDLLQQSVRYNAFQLLQSVGRDGRSNIGAKGLTGEGYEGHYFWDTETYIFPFFLYTNPGISKSLLEYRYSILDKARERARIMSQKGALFPWRTINGEETSAYYPAGTAQYHINADIIHALKQYISATEDIPFLLDKGAEMLFETARLWADLGNHIPGRGFCIHAVTGPDEYTAVVNNNAYTNLMAKDHLEFAAATARRLKEEHPDEYRKLADQIRLVESEVAEWERAAAEMFIPYDADLGIVSQDDSFLEKPVWDFENTPKDKYPLLLHYHPLVIYRHQVLKQADVVLALLLQSWRFQLAEKKRNYDYYERITTHDSSLSPCTYSIIAAEVGYKDKAYEYFKRTARMDLDDVNGNVKDGVHTASMAGTWLSIVYGFGGMREHEGVLMFNPIIPEVWEAYRFKVTFRGRRIDVHVSHKEVRYSLLEGAAMTVRHGAREVHLEAGKISTISTKRALEAVVFDLDGVIVDTAEQHYQAWKMLADEIGVHFDRQINERLKGVDRMASLNIILERSDRTYSLEEKQTMAARKNGYYVELIQRIVPSDLLPGIAELLQELKKQGIKTALASASKNAPMVIDRLQIGDYFDVIVDAGSLAKGKPDPEIFMKAAELLGVPRSNCVGVEDAEAGIQSIKAAGMLAVGVGTPDQMHAADMRLDSTAQLSLNRLLETFNGKSS